MRDPEQVAAEFAADGQPYAVFIDNNLGSQPGLSARAVPGAAAARTRSGAPRSRSTSPTIRRWSARWRWPAARASSSASSRSPTTTSPTRSKKTPRTADYARRVRMLHDHGIQVNGSFVLGFDHDRQDVFARTAEWIEENRLECATFHILTPYPARRCSGRWKRRGGCCTRLDAVRHGARGFPPEAHDARGAGGRLRLALPAAFLARIDLAPPPAGLAGGAAVSGDVVPVQAIEPVLAPV